MQDIKMIICDLDGTLLTPDETVSRRNQEAFLAAQAKGVAVAIATGRSQIEAQEAIRAIHCDHYGIFIAGSQVFDLARRQFLYRELLDPQKCLAMVSIADEYPDAYFHLYHSNELYSSAHCRELIFDCRFTGPYIEFLKESLLTYPSLPEYLRQTGFTGEKLYIYGEGNTIGEIQERISQIDGLEIASPMPNSIEITSAGVNKGRAIQQLLRHMKVQAENVMGIGDSENDLPMFANVGFRVAMGNAYSCLKEQADYIAPDYRDDGVADAIEKFVLCS